MQDLKETKKQPKLIYRLVIARDRNAKYEKWVKGG